MKSNLQYVSPKTRAFIEDLLDSHSTHFFTQEIILKGLGKDCVDAVHDAQLALDALKLVADDILGTPSPRELTDDELLYQGEIRGS